METKKSYLDGWIREVIRGLEIPDGDMGHTISNVTKHSCFSGGDVNQVGSTEFYREISQVHRLDRRQLFLSYY